VQATGQPYRGLTSRSVKMLVIQPTPFCNINCDYCYLSNRQSTKRMAKEKAVEILDRLVSADMLGQNLSIVWHAGEPLVLPPSYYREVFDGMASRRNKLKIRHSLQTNGMLINDEWCDLFLNYGINLGVSVDGPAFIHDAHRKDRMGRGTHAKVMEGIRTLGRRSVPFQAIAVVTADSLLHPKEIFNFFLEAGVERVGFNIEELGGANLTTSLGGPSRLPEIRHFFETIARLQDECDNKLWIREFHSALTAIRGEHFQNLPNEVRNTQTLPLAILTITWDGAVTTFSPELIDAPSEEHGDFILGNIFTDSIADLICSPKFVQMANAVEEGCQRCAADCRYFSVCAGGSPSNKYFENGSFNSTETTFCRSLIQIPIDLMLAEAEMQMGITAPQRRGACRIYPP
jgi:uncharacterized protein